MGNQRANVLTNLEENAGMTQLKNSFHANLLNAGCEKLKRLVAFLRRTFLVIYGETTDDPFSRGMKFIADFRPGVVLFEYILIETRVASKHIIIYLLQIIYLDLKCFIRLPT